MKRISALLATLAISGFSHAGELVKGSVYMVYMKEGITSMIIQQNPSKKVPGPTTKVYIVDGKTPQTVKDTLLHPGLLGRKVAVYLEEDNEVSTETRKVVVGLVRSTRL